MPVNFSVIGQGLGTGHMLQGQSSDLVIDSLTKALLVGGARVAVT